MLLRDFLFFFGLAQILPLFTASLDLAGTLMVINH